MPHGKTQRKTGTTKASDWKSIGLVLKTGSHEWSALVRQVGDTVARHGAELVVEPEAAACVPGSEELPLEDVAARVDLLIVFGGDGTVLGVCRAIGERDVPVLGINLGQLGFLADVHPEEVSEALRALFAGEYDIKARTRLAVTLLSDDAPAHPLLVLNDAVITGTGSVARMVDLETRVNGNPMGHFRADGLIVSTPTGSTAYSLGAGGAILDPNVPAMIVTPICPQATAHQHPIVVADTCVVEVQVESSQSVNLTLDGQVGIPLTGGDGIRVRRSRFPSRFVRLRDYDYYHTLRTKLLWGSR